MCVFVCMYGSYFSALNNERTFKSTNIFCLVCKHVLWLLPFKIYRCRKPNNLSCTNLHVQMYKRVGCVPFHCRQCKLAYSTINSHQNWVFAWNSTWSSIFWTVKPSLSDCRCSHFITIFVFYCIHPWVYVIYVLYIINFLLTQPDLLESFTLTRSKCCQ